MKRLFKFLLAYIPTELPTGMTSLNKWLDEIVYLVGPIADKESVMFVVGHECVQLPNTRNRISKMAVVKRVRKYAFNQCMSVILKDINDRHVAAQIAAKQQEATTPTTTQSGKKETTQ